MKTTKKTSKKISVIQEEIIKCLQMNPYATVREVQMKLKSMTIDGIQYHINRLKSMGLLKRIGPDKGGYWQIILWSIFLVIMWNWIVGKREKGIFL